MNYNRVILAGRLTRDPQLTYTPGNTAVCKFGIATNRKWRDRDGNPKESVCFVDVTAFGKQGEVINQYLSKGRGILIEGYLNYQQWTDKEGKNRSKLDVVVENFQFLGDRGGGGGEGAGRAGGGGYAQRGGYNQGARPGPSVDEPPPMDDDGPPQGDDIPF